MEMKLTEARIHMESLWGTLNDRDNEALRCVLSELIRLEDRIEKMQKIAIVMATDALIAAESTRPMDGQD